MSNKLALDRIELAVVNILDEVDQYIAKAEAADEDGEKDQEDIKNEDIKTEDGIELLKARIAQGLSGMVVSRVRGVLYVDNEIRDSAKHFKPDPDSRFIKLDANVAEFHIVPDRFEAWKEKHQRAISTNFVFSQNYKYPVVDQYRLTYKCQCAGQKVVRKDALKGGKSGNPRMRNEGIKKGCLSKIHALFKPIPVADGFSKPECIVEYHYQHNHSVGDITDLGTRQKSAAIRTTIERLINQGSTIQ
ncbi:hypothetical protein KI688_007931 [Linnemannia hyalina]|uniref:Uncharacterized protein n=1 Tax=Linnemannia hyalina TaxID=64524 RepID=A0A9P7XHU2_9FUNG|nr:hypothetical protein KI688_007931 [Linnemannia hyalina]